VAELSKRQARPPVCRFAGRLVSLLPVHEPSPGFQCSSHAAHDVPDSPVSMHACRMAPTLISSVGLSGRTQAVSEAEPAPAPAPVGTAQRSDSPLGRQIALATRAPATRISAKAAHRGLGASPLMGTGGASGFRRMRRARSIAALRIAPSRSCGCEINALL
jgi:hypothetical protein